MKKLVLAAGVAVMLFGSAVFAESVSLAEQENLDTGIWWNGMENMGGQLVFSDQSDAFSVVSRLVSNSEAGQKLSEDQVGSLINGDEGYAVVSLKDLLSASLAVVEVADQKADEEVIVAAYAQAHSAYYLACSQEDNVDGALVSCVVATDSGLDGDTL